MTEEAPPSAGEAAEKEYNYFTKEASKIARHLAFVGLAMVWVLKGTPSGVSAIAMPWKAIALLLVAALAFDLAEYVVIGVWWVFVYRDARRENNRPFLWVEYWTAVLWFAKIAAVLVGYAWLLVKLW